MLESGVSGRAAVPSGASTGSKEAIELRDGDAARYFGKGVLQAVENVNTEICEAIIGLDATRAGVHRQDADRPRRHREQVAARRQRASSRCRCAVAKAAAEESSLPLYRYLGGAGEMQLPVPMMNVINGGAHANNKLDLQEFMLVPLGAPSFREALRCGAEVFHTLKKIIDEQGHADDRRRRRRLRAEPAVATRRRCSCSSRRSTRRATCRAPTSRSALDCAASEFYKDGVYNLASEGVEAHALADGRRTSRPGATSIRSSASRTAWPSTTGTAGSS